MVGDSMVIHTRIQRPCPLLMTPRPRPAAVARLTAILAGVVLICGGAWLSLDPGPPVDDRPPVPTASALPSPAPASSAAVAPVSTGLFEVPSVGLSAPLLNMAVPTSGAINPATDWDAYVVDGYGVPADPQSGTVFVAMHSGRGSSHAIGDALVGRDTGKPTPLSREATVIIDGVKFLVEGSRVAEKGTLSGETDLWDGTYAGVLITCQQYADGRPSANAIIMLRRP